VRAGVRREAHALLRLTADDGAATLTYARFVTTAWTDTSAPSGPALRSSLVVDGALAAALGAFILVTTYFASHAQPARRPFDAGTIALILVAAGSLAARRRHPVIVMEVVFGATLLYFVIGYANGPIWLALIVAYVTAVVLGHRLAAAITAVTGFVIFPWLDYLLRDGRAPSVTGLAGLAAWLLVLLGGAEIVRIRRERVAEAAQIREGEALRRASEERLRIARELHDALGHHLSLINVQSGVALHLSEELPAQARNSLSAIKQASKEGLTELRSVLDILRHEGEPAPRSPMSTLARLDDLVSQAAAAGLEVRTETEGVVRPLPFGVDVAAFRIVQEALTNVTRHAGVPTATVRVSYGERDLTVQVDDEGRNPPPPSPAGAGTGLIGMRERAGALGGRLEAGPRPGGGFRVRARFPLDALP
jgi:signal transduction histidine kinase